jgi:hypothetical protein
LSERISARGRGKTYTHKIHGIKPESLKRKVSFFRTLTEDKNDGC